MNDHLPFLGKVCIVTGGSSGIGQATCLKLAEVGFHVAVIGTRSEKVNETVQQLSALPSSIPQPHHLGLVLDVSQESDMMQMAQSVLTTFGRIDVLVASAGIAKQAGSERVMPYPTASLPLTEWNAMLQVNLTGIFLSNRAVLPQMLAQGSGHIINIGSCTTLKGLRGEPYAPAYCASKFGVLGFTESLAAEVSAQGVQAQVLLPGLVTTTLTAQTGLTHRFKGRVMTPETVAETIFHLLMQPIGTLIVHPHLVPLGGKVLTDSPAS
jgi:NAD(P)-dependent dehydrogenase (short-subunit alcohol dehydrogenase family)